MAIEHNLEIRQGEDFAQAFVARRNGAVVDITGYTIESHIRKRMDDEDITEQFDCVIVDGPAGHFYVSLPAARTVALPAGRTKWERASRYYYDVRLTSPEGTGFVPIEGAVRVDPSVTRVSTDPLNVFDGGSPSTTAGVGVDGGGA